MDLIKPQNLTLTREQLAMLMPYLVVSLGAMLSLMIGVMGGAARRVQNNLAVCGVSVITVIAGIYAVSSVWGEPAVTLFNGMLSADYFSNLFNVVLLGATGLVILGSYSYLEKEG